MAIVNNTTNEEGDILIVESTVPIDGVTSFNSFSLSVNGETGSLFYQVKYRTSTNSGSTFSPFKELNDTNIQNEVFDSIDLILIEYQLEQVGNGTLEFNSIAINANFVSLPPAPYYDLSLFKEFFTRKNPQVIEWASAVLEKAIKTNNVFPKRVKISESKDFQQFYFSLCLFWSYIVRLGREFKNTYFSQETLTIFLNDFGICIPKGFSLTTLQNISNNLFRQVSLKGTSDQSELRRLTRNENLVSSFYRESGWYIDFNSPVYEEPVFKPIIEDTVNSFPFTTSFPCINKIDYLVEFEVSFTSTVDELSVEITDQNGLDFINIQGTQSVDAFQPSNTSINYLIKLPILSINTPLLPNENSFPENSIVQQRLNTSFINVHISTNNSSNVSISNFIIKCDSKNYSYGSFVFPSNQDFIIDNQGSLQNESVKNKILQEYVPANTETEITFI